MDTGVSSIVNAVRVELDLLWKFIPSSMPAGFNITRPFKVQMSERFGCALLCPEPGMGGRFEEPDTDQESSSDEGSQLSEPAPPKNSREEPKDWDSSSSEATSDSLSPEAVHAEELRREEIRKGKAKQTPSPTTDGPSPPPRGVNSQGLAPGSSVLRDALAPGTKRLINEALGHIDDIGIEVKAGHYDLIAWEVWDSEQDASINPKLTSYDQSTPQPQEGESSSSAPEPGLGSESGSGSESGPGPAEPPPPGFVASVENGSGSPTKDMGVKTRNAVILPELWELVIEPGMLISMVLWPWKKKKKKPPGNPSSSNSGCAAWNWPRSLADFATAPGFAKHPRSQRRGAEDEKEAGMLLAESYVGVLLGEAQANHGLPEGLLSFADFVQWALIYLRRTLFTIEKVCRVPKRQRVPLTEQTFLNPDVRPEMAEVKSDRISMMDVKPDGIENMALPKRDVGIRAKKPKASERVSKGDGSVVLSTNNAYTVSKLPAIPDRLRADITASQHGDVFSDSGYAVTLTHTHAIVWPYASTTPSPETFTFALPYPSKNPTDPLPLASLVAPSASSTEPGLVVVMPVSGRITFWESISCAATIDLMRQQRHGVENVLQGLSSGERVIQISSAESAGFVLALSSGRLVHMMVRDSHGRPAISVRFLDTSLGASPSGIFGSIRHALSHTTGRGDIAAVRAERSNRVGERNVVAATVKGKLVAWRFHRGGRYDKLVEADVRDAIVNAFYNADDSAAEFPAESFEFIDFTYVPKGLESRYRDMSRLSDAMDSTDNSVQHLLAVVSLTKRFSSKYALVEVILSPRSTVVGMVRPISCYTTPVSTKPAVNALRPRIHLPRPALVAFVVFDRAAVVASIAIPPLSPDSQLQEDSHVAPDLYEDVVDLRDDNILEIIGSGFEEPPAATLHDDSRTPRHKAKNPTAVIMVRGVGMLRIATTDVDKFASEKAPRVTAKSKLEQAVFYGVKADNPLLFDGRRDAQFSHEELSQAALLLSQEILSSSNPHIGTLPVSLEENLKSRGLALERLIQYLALTNVQMERRIRWSLLWNAEKMAVSAALWKKHETFLAQRPVDNKKTLITEIVEYIHEDQKTNPNAVVGEVDRVRHWFINDVGRLDIFVAWAYEVIKHMYKGQTLDDIRLSYLMEEAVSVNVITLKGGIEFRLKISPSMPWTGSHFVCNNAKRLLELCHQWLQQFYPVREDLRQSSSRRPSASILAEIVADLPALTDQYLLSVLEQSRWASSTTDAKKLQWAHVCAEAYESSRYEKVLALESLELWAQAMVIAEKHRCWPALSDVLIVQIKALVTKAEDPTVAAESSDVLMAQAETLRDRLKGYFDRYGQDFAFAAYDTLLAKDGAESVLDFDGDDHGYKTQYLRSNPSLAKISWIHDLEEEKDLSHAAHTLLDLGLSKESLSWNKKIELSLGKLALMASDANLSRDYTSLSTSAKVSPESATEAQLFKVDSELEIIKIQDALFSHVYATVETAVDDAAELELAMETHAPDMPKKYKIFHQLVETGIRRLLKHEVLDPLTLIDVLTLARFDEASDIGQERFFLALCVAHLALSGEEYKQTRRLIWRRCYIRDDWVKINDTQRKADVEVATVIANTTLFNTCAACFGNYQDLNEHFKSLNPSECLHVYSNEFDRRFKDVDKSFQDKLVDAMKWEDVQLRRYLDKSRLVEWAQSTEREARDMVNGLLDDTLAKKLAATRVHVEGDADDDSSMLDANGSAMM
ncbi:unnamed protein product [Parascedosporium putredinis]|uniref:Uncharacterized protein n=1 Tax=Parascedosporium putredinis TaxID=1442378 RepID=A0A9P1H479_9PEZI|nr:unnamed protein product [Parascedosporium putredinis]CAI7995441.1 unnamed protein product [Parascedosporium putredinis]